MAGTLNANGKAAGSATQQDAESGLLVVHGTQDPGVSNSTAFALGRNNGQENAVLAFSCKDHGADAGAISPTLRAMNHSGSHANADGMKVRQAKKSKAGYVCDADGPRYKAIGNSKAVTVVRWIEMRTLRQIEG